MTLPISRRTLFILIALLILTISLLPAPAGAAHIAVTALSCEGAAFAGTVEPFSTNLSAATNYVMISFNDEPFWTMYVPDSGDFEYVAELSQAAPSGTSFTLHIIDAGGHFAVNTGACDAEPEPEFEGPSMPADYTLHTITCDTPVYDEPGGSVITGAALKAGQVFGVNPEPFEDAAGKLWAQVYVSSASDPFIPASCVAGFGE